MISMKDFPFWHSALYNSKTALILKAVWEDLNNFQNQSDFLAEGNKLTEDEMAILRKMYSEMLKKLVKDALPPKPPSKRKSKK